MAKSEAKGQAGKEFIAFEQHVLDSSRVGSSARKIQSRFLPRFPVCFACYTAESFKIICLTCIWFKFVDTTFNSSQKKPQKHTTADGHFTTIVCNHCVKLKTARGLELGPNWLNLLTSCGPNLEAIGSNAIFLRNFPRFQWNTTEICNSPKTMSLRYKIAQN